MLNCFCSSQDPPPELPAVRPAAPNPQVRNASTAPKPIWYCPKCEDVFREACSPQMTMNPDSRTGQPNIKFHGKNNTTHHKSYKALRRSAQSGCRPCIVIHGELKLQLSVTLNSPTRLPEFARPIHFEIKTGTMDMDAFQLYFLVKFKTPEDDKNSIFEITLRADAVTGRFNLYRDKLVDLVTSQPLSSYTGSPESLELASNWLRTCNDTHVGCRERPKPDYFPTRALDLGPPGSYESHTRIHLFILPTSRPRPYAPYMTLSHQWSASSERSPILKSHNLAQFCQSGFEIGTLPQVFRDAIELTRRFGVRYLWIDRLCIIQDSEDDWRHEAQLMQRVYASSYCSIAASDADHPFKGCFFERQPEVVTPWRRKMPNDRQEEFVIVPRSGVTTGVMGDEAGEISSRNWRKALSNSTKSLYKRGWVLQQSILAPRILHCSSRQLYWECPSIVCCETIPAGMPEPFWVLDDTFQLRRGLAAPALGQARVHFRSGRGDDRPDAPNAPDHNEWKRIVEAYTRCQLTYAKDKLIAISGVVGALAPLLGKYHLGLWANDLPMGLLWYLDGRPGLNRKPGTIYRALTWSWASIDGPVSFYSNPLALSAGDGSPFKVVIDAASAATESRHPDGLGKIMPNTLGKLRLKGGLVPVVLGLYEIELARGIKKHQLVLASVRGKDFEHFEITPPSRLPQDLEMDRMLSLLVGASELAATGQTYIREQYSNVLLDNTVAGMLVSTQGEL